MKNLKNKIKMEVEAWETCDRGDRMLEFAQKLNCPLQLLTLAKATCAATVVHLMCDKRSRKAIKVAIDFGNGNASREELMAAACAADAAADAAAASAEDAAEYAAKAAAYAALDHEADAAAFAAANAAASAFADAAADAAKKANQQQTANICREILTDFILSKL